MEDVQSALCTVNDDNTIQDMKEQTMDNDEDMDCDSGAENLDLMVGLMDEHSELQSEIVKLCNSFVEDVGERMKTCDIPYLTGLKKFFSVYLETINSTEPTYSATPKLSSLLHTYFSNTQTSLSLLAGTRKCMYNPQQFLGDEKVLPKVVIWHLVDVLARGIWNTQMRTHSPNEEESNIQNVNRA